MTQICSPNTGDMFTLCQLCNNIRNATCVLCNAIHKFHTIKHFHPFRQHRLKQDGEVQRMVDIGHSNIVLWHWVNAGIHEDVVIAQIMTRAKYHWFLRWSSANQEYLSRSRIVDHIDVGDRLKCNHMRCPIIPKCFKINSTPGYINFAALVEIENKIWKHKQLTQK